MNKELNFLVIIDETREMHNAIRYASLISLRVGGSVVILYTFDNIDFGHWQAVENIAEKESRDEAEERIKEYESTILTLSKRKPKKFIMKGDRIDCIIKFLESNKCISNLILAASSGPVGPGPLISGFTGKFRTKLKVPLTIIPSDLSEEEIDNLF